MSSSVACRLMEPVTIHVNAPSEVEPSLSDEEDNNSFQKVRKTLAHSVSSCTTEKSKNSETMLEKRASKDSFYIKVPMRRLSISKDTSSTSSLSPRRGSYKGLAQSITGMISLRNSAIPKPESPTTELNFENSYRMFPDSDQHIDVSIIKQIATQILEEEINSKEYSSFSAGELASDISAKIKKKVKKMNFPRYRIICQVILMQARGQGLEAVSRCLWNASSDSYTTATYNNNKICAVAMVYGVYFD